MSGFGGREGADDGRGLTAIDLKRRVDWSIASQIVLYQLGACAVEVSMQGKWGQVFGEEHGHMVQTKTCFLLPRLGI